MAQFLPALFPPTFRGEDGTVAVYSEASAVIVVLVLLGQEGSSSVGRRTLAHAAGLGCAGHEPRVAQGIVNAVAALIISRPCALGLSTPMSVIANALRLRPLKL